MQLNHSISNITSAAISRPYRSRFVPAAVWSRHLWSLGLIALWATVLAGLPHALLAQLAGSIIPEAVQIQLASWLTFFALFITPGWLAADLLTWRLDVDWLERQAVALPL